MPTAGGPHDLAGALETVLRTGTATPDLRVAAPPVALSGGFDTDVYAFEQSGGPGWLPELLVLRLFRASSNPRRAEIEAAVQNAAATTGLPVPKVFATSATRLIEGRAFVIMARLPGTSMIAAFGDPSLRANVPTLLATTLIGIHTLDPSVLQRVIAATGADPARFTPDRLLDRIDWFIETAGLTDLAGIAQWLHQRRPQPNTAPVICHGDLHPGNLMVDRGEITGIIDWSNVALAPPEYDLAVTRFALAIGAALLGGQPSGAEIAPVTAALTGFIDIYRRHRSVATDLVDYYTVLRAAHPLTEIIAARRDPTLAGEVREGEIWQHPPVLKLVTQTLRRLTGIDVSP